MLMGLPHGFLFVALQTRQKRYDDTPQ